MQGWILHYFSTSVTMDSTEIHTKAQKNGGDNYARFLFS